MTVAQVLQLFMDYNELIIQGLSTVVLLLLLYFGYRTFFGSSSETESQAPPGEGVARSVEGDGALWAGGGQGTETAAQNFSAPPQQVEELKAQLTSLQVQLQQRDQAITSLSSSLEAEKKKVTEAAAAPTTAGGGDEELKQKVEELEAKLSEYEIIEDDIADLSFYKTEASRLQSLLDQALAEAENVQASAPAAPKVEAAAEPEPIAEPEPEPQAETEPEAEAEAEAEPVAESEPEVDTEPEVEAEVESESGDGSEPGVEPESGDSLLESQEEPELEADVETVPALGAEPEPEAQPEPALALAPEPETEPEAAPQQEASSEESVGGAELVSDESEDIGDDLLAEFAVAVETQSKMNHSAGSTIDGELDLDKMASEAVDIQADAEEAGKDGVEELNALVSEIDPDKLAEEALAMGRAVGGGEPDLMGDFENFVNKGNKKND